MSLAKSSLVNYSFGKIACKWGQTWVARVPWQVLPYCSGFYCSCLWQSHSNFDMFQWWIQGECQGGPDPQTSLSDLTLVWDWKFYIDRIVYHFSTGWYLLIKHALHFATKLNSRDIKKCNCFWVPFYDLFTSACKAVFPAPIASRGSQIEKHAARQLWRQLGWWPLSMVWRVWRRSNFLQKSSTVLSEPKFGPPQ